MCPRVIWDARLELFRMWYSGGEQYEPDAIGYATSADGMHWRRNGQFTEGKRFGNKRWPDFTYRSGRISSLSNVTCPPIANRKSRSPVASALWMAVRQPFISTSNRSPFEMTSKVTGPFSP